MSKNLDPASDKTEFHDLDQFPNAHVNAGDYTRTLGCIHDLMPYAHFAQNPWEELKQLKDWLQDQPRTMATFCFRDLPDDTETNWDKIERKRTLVHVLGGWQSHTANQRPRWVNPYYLHIDELDWTPVDDKWPHYQEMAALGKIDVNDLARRYNVAHQNVSGLCQRRGYRFKELRNEGKRKLANTVVVTQEWCGYDLKALAKLLDLPERTLGTWVEERADVTVPPRPCTHDRAKKWGYEGPANG